MIFRATPGFSAVMDHRSYQIEIAHACPTMLGFLLVVVCDKKCSNATVYICSSAVYSKIELVKPSRSQ